MPKETIGTLHADCGRPLYNVGNRSLHKHEDVGPIVSYGDVWFGWFFSIRIIHVRGPLHVHSHAPCYV